MAVQAGTWTVQEPVPFSRGKGQPVSGSFAFAVRDPSARYDLNVYNGGTGLGSLLTDRVSSAVISLNGTPVYLQNDFNQRVGTLTRSVSLAADNRVEVLLNGKPGGTLYVEVIGYDDVPPTIEARVEPAPNAAGWNRTSVVVRFTCGDKTSGVASCPEPVPVELEGRDQTVSGTAVDRAGNQASTAITLHIDKTAAVITPALEPAPNAAGWNRVDTTVHFTCTDALSGVAECAEPVTVSAEGAAQPVRGDARDVADNTSHVETTVSLDKTPPQIAVTPNPPANERGWHNETVTLTYSCTDALSGVANCAPAQTPGEEGANQTFTGSVTDVADNGAETAITLHIDKTVPTIAASITPAANSHGWHRVAPTVAFTCADALSGILFCPEPVTLTNDGAGQRVGGTVVDNADNQAATEVVLHLDRTAPQITARVEPAPNAAGWNNASVVVRFTCTDALSGIDHCPEPVPVELEGREQTVSGTAVDRAGNQASTAITLHIGKTAAVITPALEPAPNAAGWNRVDTTVHFTCTDALSGVAECAEPVTVSAEGAAQPVRGDARDVADNISHVETTVSLDKTPPQIAVTPNPPANERGWHNDTVTLTYSCTDALSGVASCPPAQTPADEGANQTFTGTVVDVADNRAETTATLNIDKTAPTIAASITPAVNSHGWHRVAPTVAFTCADALSGVLSCPEPVALTSEGAGQRVGGTVVDNADNRAATEVVLHLDRTAPQITARVEPAPNAAGWNNASVVVRFTCTDALSGVDHCPEPVPVELEGRDQTISGTAVDRAGNQASTAITLHIDKTAAVITPALEPTPNAAGWNRVDTTVRFTCTDALSGVAECAEPVAVSVEGAAQPVRGDARDVAGNTSHVETTVSLDKTPPQIVVAPTPPANERGWHNETVTLTYSCTDALSGVANCTPAQTPGEEGANQTFTGSVTDVADNGAETAITLHIDKTVPTIAASVTPVANGNGWHRAAPTVAFTCADALSGVLSCPEPVTLTNDGAGQRVGGTVFDNADNQAATEVVLHLDRTAPQITAHIEPAPNAAGWNNASAVVHFTCSDALSGIDHCPEPIPVELEGRDQTISGTAVDRAGNEASTSLTLHIDKTAVVITPALEPAPNAAGWNRVDTTVHFTCTDALSGVAECAGPVTVSAEGAAQPVRGDARDVAGNISHAETTVSLDKTPPQILVAPTPPANERGWHNGTVTLTYNCTDALSGVASCTPAQTPAGEGANQTFTGTVVDVADNRAETTATLNIDKTAPTIAASVTPAANGNGWHRVDPTVSFACEDGLSGLLSCPEPITVSHEGADQPVEGTAIDNAGNTAVAAVTIRLDKTPPSAAFSYPAEGAVVTDNPPAVELALADNLAVDPTSIRIAVNGTPVAADCTVEATSARCTLPGTIPGTGASLQAEIADLSGNSASAAVSFLFDNDGDGVIDADDLFPVDPSEWADLDGDGVGNNSDPDRDGDGFSNEEELAEGRDPDDASSFPDRTPPVIELSGPAERNTEADIADLFGRVSDDHSGVSRLTVASDRFAGIDFAAIIEGENWTVSMPLEIGTNQLTLSARDGAGNESHQSVTVQRDNPNSVLGLTIEYPLANTVLTKPEVTVRGLLRSDVPALAVTVEVNGVPAVVSPTDEVTLYRFASAPLILAEGVNTLYIQGKVDGAPVQRSLIVRYQPEQEAAKPPVITILAPVTGSYLSEPGFYLAGSVVSLNGLTRLTVNGQSVPFGTGMAPEYRFREFFSFGADEQVLTLAIMAEDAAGLTVATQATYYRDTAAPVIQLDRPLLASPEENLVTEQPYRLQGLVQDEHLASLRINDAPLGVEPQGPGQYRFDIPLALDATAQTITLAAADHAGNRSEAEYVLRLDASVTVAIVTPEEGADYVHTGDPLPLRITARLGGTLPAGAVVAAALAGADGMAAQTPLAGEGSLRTGTLNIPPQASRYRLSVTVTDAEGQPLASSSRDLDVSAAADTPLALTATEPLADQAGVEPNGFISLYFNRPVDIAKLTVQVHETAFGFTYVDADPLGTDGIGAKGYQLETVNRSFEPVAGKLSVLPNHQIVGFYPERDFAYNGEVFLEVAYAGETLGRLRFTTRPLPTFVTGAVLDPFRQPVPDIEVALPGHSRRTRTDANGAFAFGFGDSAEQTLPGGRTELVLNPGMQDPRYGTRRQWVNLQGGRRNALGTLSLNAIDQQQPWVPLEGRGERVLLNGALKLDLSAADLQFPDSRREGDVQPQFMSYSQIPYPVEPLAVPLWVYALQPAGVEVEGPLVIDVAMPKLGQSYDYVPPDGSYVVMVGLDGASGRIVPMGAGQIRNLRVVSVGASHYRRLDIIGYALAGPELQTLLGQYAEGQASLQELLRALAAGSQ
jgi:hypothetical protein